MKNLEAIPLTVASKILKCLGESLPHHAFKVKTKTAAKQRDIPGSWVPGQFLHVVLPSTPWNSEKHGRTSRLGKNVRNRKSVLPLALPVARTILESQHFKPNAFPKPSRNVGMSTKGHGLECSWCRTQNPELWRHMCSRVNELQLCISTQNAVKQRINIPSCSLVSQIRPNDRIQTKVNIVCDSCLQ